MVTEKLAVHKKIQLFTGVRLHYYCIPLPFLSLYSSAFSTVEVLTTMVHDRGEFTKRLFRRFAERFDCTS